MLCTLATGIQMVDERSRNHKEHGEVITSEIDRVHRV